MIDERFEVALPNDRPPAGNGAADALAAGHAVQQIKSSYATAVAVQKPRSLRDVQRRILEEARLAGEDFYYGWGSGKNAVEGPSVKLALALARCWGNCAIETLPVQELPDSWVFTAAFVDLETGFTLCRQFRQSKRWAVHGKLDEERKEDIRFQIGQSKAVRNVMLNALPSSLIDQAMQEARAGVREKIERYVAQKGFPAAVDLLLRALAKFGVKEPAVLGKVGVADKKALTLDHLVTLRGDLTAIEGGQERPEVLFPAAEAAQAEPAPAPAEQPRPAKKASKKTLAALGGHFDRLGMTADDRAALLEQHGVASLEEATEQQCQAMLGYVEGLTAEPAAAREAGAEG